MNYSVVIPTHNVDACPARKAALAFILSKLTTIHQITEILVISQGGTTVTEHGVRLVEVQVDDKLIHKSLLLNTGVSLAANQRVILLDCDVWLDFKTVLDALEHGVFYICKPFTEVVRLTAEKSKELMSGKMVSLAGCNTVNVLGGGALIVDKYVYQYLRGYDERFVGWGTEDVEFGVRAASLFLIRVTENKAVHIQHPRATPVENAARASMYLPIVTATKTAKLPHAHLKNVVSSLPYTHDYEELDMALVIATYGKQTALRKAAHSLALTELVRWQKYRPQVYVYEAGTDYKDLCALLGVKHVEIPHSKYNEDLFQKEAIYNIALNDLLHRKFIFCDMDAIPVCSEWARQIFDVLEADPYAVCQPYGSFADTLAKKSAISYACARSRGMPRGGEGFDGEYPQPGLMWAMNADLIYADGFNPYLFSGGGDVTFAHEYCDPLSYPSASTRRFDKQLTRKLKTGNLVCLDLPALHAYHGDYSNRAYKYSREVLKLFGDLRQYVQIDSNGLLAWRDWNTPLRYILQRKPEMQTEAGMMKVVLESLQLIRKTTEL